MSETTAKRVTRSSASRATNYDNVKENNRPEHPNKNQQTPSNGVAKPTQREPLKASTTSKKEPTEVSRRKNVFSSFVQTSFHFSIIDNRFVYQTHNTLTKENVINYS